MDSHVHVLRPVLLLVVLGLGFGLMAAGPASAGAPWAKVLEDAPGRLVLELRPPALSLQPGPDGLARPACGDCQRDHRAGAPDLPWYRFDVLSGRGEPRVTVQALETEELPVPAGLAPVPTALSPTRLEHRADAALYAAAKSGGARVSGLRHLRGLPVRGVELPLALWAEEGRTLTALRRVRVEIAFPDVKSRPASVRLPASFASAVVNPAGGPWLYEAPAAPLRRRAAAVAPPTSPGGHFLRIRIGDRNVESLSEDRFYAASYEELAASAEGLKPVHHVLNLRLFTGARDSLPRRMDAMPAKSDPTALPGMLREIPLEVIDADGDSVFGPGDTVRFYAHGASAWRRIPGADGIAQFEFSVDPYAFENAYYLGYEALVGAPPALRLPRVSGAVPASPERTVSPHYLRAEKDEETASCDPSSHKDEESGFIWFWYWKGSCNWQQRDSGRVFMRSALRSPETDTLRGLVMDGTQDSIHIGFDVYPPNRERLFEVWFGGSPDTLRHDTSRASRTRWYARGGAWPGMPALAIDRVFWTGQEKRFEGYTVRYRRRLAAGDDPLIIFPEVTGARVTYRVQDAQGALVLRVEEGVATALLAPDEQGRFTDSLPPGADAVWIVQRRPSRLPAAVVAEESIPSEGSALRDLLTGDGKKVEYLIVTARPLLAEALKLRDYRGSPGRALPLATEVVLVEDVWRQFGSGRLSPPALRNFLRWAYHHWGRAGATASPLRHVLFFGDGHYDHRGIKAQAMGAGAPPNHVPPYEFILNGGGEEIASEDFYGWLDEGDNHIDSAQLDVSIGRVPVQKAEEARAYLEKVRAYEDPRKAGEWRARAVLAADDHLQRNAENKNLDLITSGHTTDSERLGKAMVADEPALNLDRVNLLDYEINASFRKPEAAQDLLSFINRGTLMVNYVGHGASNQWADEVLLQTSDALTRLQNRDRTGMVNAFSCTVGRFESLESEGMSEQFVKQAGVGAIGAVSATRESYPGPNIALAIAFYSRVFARDTASGRAPTVGEALMHAKNSFETAGDNINDMKYALLGEPVLLLRKPSLGLALTQRPDTLRALDCGRLAGTVSGGSGTGFVNVKITAGAIKKDYVLPPPMATQYAEKRGAILFERTFPYKDGKFSSEYFLPRQLAFGDSTARIAAYAWDTEREMEGSLAVQDLRIQGAANSCPEDPTGQGPRIRVTGCEAKETGGTDFPDRVALPIPYCLQIQVEDSVGGVLSAEGPDEGTTVEIPGVLDPFHPLPGIDDLYMKSYKMSLDRQTFRPGSYVLKVSARDGFGNLGTRQIRMDLTLDSSITTFTAYNVPNPMKRNGTSFHFGTWKPPDETEVDPTKPISTEDRVKYEIRVFNQSGRIVKILREARQGVTWDGRDEWGRRLANGVYFYTVTARWDPGSGIKAAYRTVSTKRNTLVISR